MKTLLSSLMLLAIFSAFIGCSDGNSDPIPGECADCNETDPPIPEPRDPNSPANPYLRSAAEAIKKNKWDEAVYSYEKAYKADNENIEAIIYSTLANLAMISVDPAVQTLIKERLGFTTYPNKLNALFSYDWMEPAAEFERDYPDNNLGYWVEWYEEGDVYWDGSEYKTISQAGYYYYHYGLKIISTELILSNNWEWEYYDDDFGNWVYWYEAGYVGSQAGYYYEEYNYDNYEYEYVLVSTVPKYYTTWNYLDDDNNCYASWYEAGENGVSQAGYYCYDEELVLVTTTPKYSYTSLPEIVAPSWVQGDGSYYNSSLLGGNIFSMENWAIALLANVLDKNTSGANTLIDQVTSSVFNTYYNKAAERLSRLENRKEERFSLYKKFIETFELDNFIDEYDQVGWAEVNAIMSAMLAVKASLEWVASYNLDTDLSWLRGKWEDNSDYWVTKIENANANELPFNNSFLDARPDAAGKIAASKADYIKAVEGLQESYKAIKHSKLYPSKVKKAYNTLNTGAEKMKAAINNGWLFYVLEKDPTKYDWPTNSNTASVTIDFGKFFTQGYFSLNNIFEVENGKPVFYTDRDHQKLTTGNYESLLETQDLTLKLKVYRIRAVANSREISYEDIEFVDTDIDGDVAKAIFEKYYN